MGKPTGFLEYEREPMPSRPAKVRLNDFYEIYAPQHEHVLKEQGARCMDCGIPFCQSDTGCPIDNLIPEWNDLVYHGRWREAYERLRLTNNFPEFTGRICPAPCESACVLGIHDPAVTIKSIECALADRAYEQGWLAPAPPRCRTGKRVAVIGSGPAGLAAADQLNQAGHEVTVYERDDHPGGLLMYGVPNMKLDKQLIDRRVQILRQEGVAFQTSVNVGVDITGDQLRERFDAVLLACGALRHRDLTDLPGRGLAGVGFAMPYLTHATRDRLGDEVADDPEMSARDKNVIVIGGGDTGTDCISTALRQGCRGLINITRRQREPDQRDEAHPWPGPTGAFYVDYGHAEAAALFGRDPRHYELLPKAFVDDGAGHVKAVRVALLEWMDDPETGRRISREVPDSEKDLPARMVLLAIGFTGHDTPAIVEQLGLEEQRGAVSAPYADYRTEVEGVYAAGDMRRGASLIVWAIAEGRGAARAMDEDLMGRSELAAPDMYAGAG